MNVDKRVERAGQACYQPSRFVIFISIHLGIKTTDS
jgi:hypothetical protein